MGDSLEFVDFGANHTGRAVDITSGPCALFDDGSVKWYVYNTRSLLTRSTFSFIEIAAKLQFFLHFALTPRAAVATLWFSPQLGQQPVRPDRCTRLRRYRSPGGRHGRRASGCPTRLEPPRGPASARDPGGFWLAPQLRNR